MYLEYQNSPCYACGYCVREIISKAWHWVRSLIPVSWLGCQIFGVSSSMIQEVRFAFLQCTFSMMPVFLRIITLSVLCWRSLGYVNFFFFPGVQETNFWIEHYLKNSLQPWRKYQLLGIPTFEFSKNSLLTEATWIFYCFTNLCPLCLWAMGRWQIISRVEFSLA